MNLNELSEKIYQANKKKGFWDDRKNVGEVLMLVTSELAEALEADRKERYSIHGDYLKEVLNLGDNEAFKQHFNDKVKDSFEDEIADAIIRLLDLSSGFKIDIESHVRAKLRYNSLRPHKHGKRY